MLNKNFEVGSFGEKLARFGHNVVGKPYYQEVLSEQIIDGIPHSVKINYKNGKEIGRSALYSLHQPRSYLGQVDMPSFAQGGLYQIGGGDYKNVFVDDGARDDQILKEYMWHSYRGTDAKKYAEAAAFKIATVIDLARSYYPGLVLPCTIFVDKVDDQYTVWERQQRALVVNRNIFDPKTAEELSKQIQNFNEKPVEDELLRSGLSRRGPSGYITDSFGLTEIHWDAITQHLVALDVVDTVDLLPLFPELSMSD